MSERAPVLTSRDIARMGPDWVIRRTDPRPSSELLITQPPKEIYLPIRRFGAEQHERLENDGYVVLPITGRSIKQQQQEGAQVSVQSKLNLDHLRDQHGDRLVTPPTEVAFNPKKLLVEGTLGADSQKMAELVYQENRFNNAVYQWGISGLASPNVWVELINKYQEMTGTHLFGPRDHFHSAITSGVMPSGDRVVIGDHTPSYGVRVFQKPAVDDGRTGAAVLVTPSQRKISY